MKLLSYEDVLLETVKFYSEDTSRRSIKSKSSYTCVYRGEGGKLCAFSRYVRTEHVANLHEGEGASFQFKKFKNVLRDEVQHLTDHDFWQDLQDLHDKAKNWDENGLTELGEDRLNKLKIKYNSELF